MLDCYALAMITTLLRCNTIGNGVVIFAKYVYNKTILTISIAIEMEQPGSKIVQHESNN